MSDHPQKTRERILSAPAPRDIPWDRFISMWENYADRVEQESGDRLAVDMNGHRKVFRRQHDGLVGIEDIEIARHLLESGPASTEGHGSLLVLTLTEEDARFYDFDLGAHDVETSGHEHEKNPDPRGHHMRTVEKKTGRDDEKDLDRFFDDLAETLKTKHAGQRFVLLGHGTGTSDAAEQFLKYLDHRHEDLRADVIAAGGIDLSAATEADIENEAKKLAGQG